VLRGQPDRPGHRAGWTIPEDRTPGARRFTYAHRRAQVAWAKVFAAAEQALDAAPEWEEAHHLFAGACELWGWSRDADEVVAQARADRAWPEVLSWADYAAAERPDFWRSGREDARAEALVQLGRPAEAAAVRALADRRAPGQLRVRFAADLELIAVAVPSPARPGDEVPVRYVWRALHPMPANYFVVLEVRGPGGFEHGHRIGGGFGTTAWGPGERVEEHVVLHLPPNLAAGRYELRIGVRSPGQPRFHVSETDRAHTGHTATVATLLVRP
jgi:hypothetical protein